MTIARLRFWQTVKVDIFHELEVDIDSAIEYLKEIKEAFSKTGHELFLNRNSTNMNLLSLRPETDDEYKERCTVIKKRKATSKKRKEKKRTKEYKEFLKLKEKFGE